MVTSSLCIKTAGPACAATANFKAYGEIWEVCDVAKDGFGAQLEITVPGRANLITGAWEGAGTCTKVNDSIPDGTPVTYRLCLTDEGSVTRHPCLSQTDRA